MKLGISTAALYPLETEKALEFLGQNGVPVTEIFFNCYGELEDDFVAQLQTISEKYKIEINSVHACGSVGEPYYLFSEYERRYEETREFYKKYYRAAKRLGAKCVVLHGDSLKGHISFETYAKRLREMNADAAEYGVTVSHENVNRFRMAEPQNVRILRSFYSQQTFTFDIKQTIRAGVDTYEMLEAMGDRVINVHISDNKLGKDCLLPGRGSFDFKTFFENLKGIGYDGALLIEVYNWCYNDYSELIESWKYVKSFLK